MDEKDNFNSECVLCGGHHDVFDVTGCFSKTVDNILKENPHHFDRLVKLD